ncbi:hypothetical protein B0F90DRAFT_1699487 [Multifurca ochricompacta]|uniref:Smr domain-containing protein n=1 Tax=Multifurca ochricompacta TaxID=376703 RepID=A0AAD4M8N1_9AGAM|nr:hypothetical protein B0F90DRAFT_1699487 [Multifurca ochricompacta]
MKKLNRMAAGIIFRGQVDLHFLHVDEAIERAEERLQMSMSRGERTISFITGKGKRSNDGPKILPALQEHIAKYVNVDPFAGWVQNYYYYAKFQARTRI